MRKLKLKQKKRLTKHAEKSAKRKVRSREKRRLYHISGEAPPA